MHSMLWRTQFYVSESILLISSCRQFKALFCPSYHAIVHFPPFTAKQFILFIELVQRCDLSCDIWSTATAWPDLTPFPTPTLSANSKFESIFEFNLAIALFILSKHNKAGTSILVFRFCCSCQLFICIRVSYFGWHFFSPIDIDGIECESIEWKM